MTGDLAFPVAYARTVWNHHLADGGRGDGFAQVFPWSSPLVDPCDLSSSSPPVDASLLNLAIGTGDDGGPVLPKTYVIDNMAAPSPSGGVQILRGEVFADGGFQVVTTLASGTITLTAVDFQRATGSFDAQLVLGDGGTTSLSGTFDAPGCPF